MYHRHPFFHFLKRIFGCFTALLVMTLLVTKAQACPTLVTNADGSLSVVESQVIVQQIVPAYNYSSFASFNAIPTPYFVNSFNPVFFQPAFVGFNTGFRSANVFVNRGFHNNVQVNVNNGARVSVHRGLFGGQVIRVR